MNHEIPERIALTLWVGGMWTVGYLVAPLLFAVLDDRALAGMLAGELFSAMSYVGLACGGVLLLNQWWRGPADWREWRRWLLLGMLLVILLAEFILQPWMAQLKAAGLSPDSEAARQFGRLHGLASSLFLFNSLAGLVLVIFGLRAAQARGN